MQSMRSIFSAREDSNTIENLNKDLFFKEINDVCSQIACTEMWFEMEEDPDLIDSIIYQRESLIARYRYLLKKAKRYNVTSKNYV